MSNDIAAVTTVQQVHGYTGHRTWALIAVACVQSHLAQTPGRLELKT